MSDLPPSPDGKEVKAETYYATKCGCCERTSESTNPTSTQCSHCKQNTSWTPLVCPLCNWRGFGIEGKHECPRCWTHRLHGRS